MSGKVLIQSRLTRIFHWTYTLCVIILLISGFYIYNPVDLGNAFDMQMNILLQTSFGFVATGIFVAWVYHHIVTQAYKDILVKRRDAGDLIGLLKYYIFKEKKPPVHGKYNAGQRIIFTSWVFFFIFMFVTGIILYLINFGNIIPVPVLIQKVRFYHFFGAVWFLCTVPVHIYLALTEDPAKLQAIFTGWVKKPQK